MSDTDPAETVAMALAVGPSTNPLAIEANGATIPEVFDADRRYEVTFAAAVEMPPFRYGPRDGAVLMKGGVLNRILTEKGRDVFRTAIAR